MTDTSIEDDFDRSLKEKYPTVTKQFSYAECGQGWYPLVDRLFSALEKIATQDPDDENPLSVIQLKSKFGELRCYTNWMNEAADEVIRQAEVEASYTCERCGAVESETRYDIGWHTVLCNDCYRKTKEKLDARVQ